MQSLGERIKYLRELNNLNQDELAKAFNGNKSTVSRIEKNQTNPTSIILLAIANFFNVSTDWLLTGEEKVHTKQSNSIDLPPHFIKLLGDVSDDEVELILNYRKLPDIKKGKLLGKLEVETSVADTQFKKQKLFLSKDEEVATKELA
ncbi:helix-turn-helix domain-containing protein [Vallitalea maricola]|uniref:Helix-turn-helix domain-containing protein n=1 Tax=Vallitalea maricola TaxID=3074433 RepID=A0ACB5UGZ8_9FIRM|nr:helix-turn-helix domain-containing protein [Vallitalea sp. AN17-2]